MAWHQHSTTTQQLVEGHMWLMAFAWLVGVPAGVGVAMVGRQRNVKWWPKAHMWIMGLLVGVPMTAGAIMGFIATGGIRPRPHLVSHQREYKKGFWICDLSLVQLLGTIIVVGAWFQITLGVVNHMLFRRRCQRGITLNQRPWNNTVHVWLGRLLATLSLINIPLGMKMHKVSVPWFIVYAVWTCAIVVAALGVRFMALRLARAQAKKRETRIDIDIDTAPDADIKERK